MTAPRRLALLTLAAIALGTATETAAVAAPADATKARPIWRRDGVVYKPRTGNLKFRYHTLGATRVKYRVRVLGHLVVNKSFRLSRDGGYILTVHLRGGLRQAASRSRSFYVTGSARVSGPGGARTYTFRRRLR